MESETRVFHLPTDECTITLEDVHMLLGLRVTDFAVNGKTNVTYSKTQELLGIELLGIELMNTDRKGQSIKMKWLREHYDDICLNENSPSKQ